jgi:hypothetical protein
VLLVVPLHTDHVAIATDAETGWQTLELDVSVAGFAPLVNLKPSDLVKHSSRNSPGQWIGRKLTCQIVVRT